jgi:hypothetical protein
LSASVSSRVLFEVRSTSGMRARLDRAQLGDRDLEVGEDLEQHRLELLVGLVDLVDQQHDRLLGGDRLVSSGRASRNSSPKMSSWISLQPGRCPRRRAASAWIRSSCLR